MSTLSAADRRALPASAFVFPKTRAYPIHDENHARAALSDVARYGTPDEKAKVRAAVAKRHPQVKESTGRMSVHEQVQRSAKLSDMGSG